MCGGPMSRNTALHSAYGSVHSQRQRHEFMNLSYRSILQAGVIRGVSCNSLKYAIQRVGGNYYKNLLTDRLHSKIFLTHGQGDSSFQNDNAPPVSHYEE